MNAEKNGIERYLNDFATKSFLHVGDQDYIAARICYRNELMLQYYWSALQAIEKYFKAIMLYNRVPSIEYGHDLEDLYRRLTQIEGLGFSLTESQLEYLERIHRLGANRYMTLPTEHDTREIVYLDDLVCAIRGYCTAEASIQFPDKRSIYVASIKSKLANNERVLLCHGYLEKELEKKDSTQRAALIWNNLYYGQKRKSVKLPTRWGRSNPTNVNYPEMIERLFELVRFSKSEKDILRQHKNAVKKKQKSRKS